MLIPLSTNRPRRRAATLTYTLIAANTAIHLGGLVLQTADPDLFAQLLNRFHVWGHHFQWHQLLTSAFLHGGWLHLIFNMIVLAALGPNVEDKLGHVGYAVLYTLGAAASGGAHVAFSDHPAIGASGAIAAVTGAYLILFPSTRIMCLFFLGIITRVAVPAWWFIGLNIAIDLFQGGFGGSTGIAHMAHLGGYGFGMLSMLVLLWTRVLKRESYDMFTLIRQKKRRSEIVAAARQNERTVQQRVGADSAKPESPRRRAMLEARAKVGEHVAAGRLDEAADEYRVFADEFDDEPGTTLSRDLQLRLAEHLVRTGDRAAAAGAYSAFAETFPDDREAPSSLLMAGLLLVRHLGRAADARLLIERALPRLTGDERSLAEGLLAEIPA